jgi:hypothetical protein
MGSLVLFKVIACLVVVFRSPWISFTERSRSSFALVVSCVQVRSCFLSLAIPTRVVSGRSKPMRVGLRTGILGLRALMDDILFYSEENVLNMREIPSANTEISFEASFRLQPFVNIKCEPNL